MAPTKDDAWYLPGFDDYEGPVRRFAETRVESHPRIPPSPARRTRQFLSDLSEAASNGPRYRRSRSESPVGSRRENLEENNFRRISVARVCRDEHSYWSQPRPWAREMQERYEEYKAVDNELSKAIKAYDKDANEAAKSAKKGGSIEGAETFGICWQWHQWLAPLADKWHQAAVRSMTLRSAFAEDFPTAVAFWKEVKGHEIQVETSEASAANAAAKRAWHAENIEPGLFWAVDPHDTFDRRCYHTVDDIQSLLNSPNPSDVSRGHKKERSNARLSALMKTERMSWDYTK